MRYRKLTFLSGVIAALAMASSAQALSVKVGGSNGGGTSVSVGSGGGSGTSANVSAGSGSGTSATANVGVGGSNAASVNASIGTGATQSLSAKAGVNLGTPGETLRAKADLNGDGLIDAEDDALLALDINGDGVISLLDGANASINLGVDAGIDVGDFPGGIEVGSLPDVSIDIGSIDLGTGGGPDETPAPGEFSDPGGDPGAEDIAQAIRGLDDNQIPALKLKCVDVLRSPAAFDAATISVCRVLASL